MLRAMRALDARNKLSRVTSPVGTAPNTSNALSGHPRLETLGTVEPGPDRSSFPEKSTLIIRMVLVAVEPGAITILIGRSVVTLIQSAVPKL